MPVAWTPSPGCCEDQDREGRDPDEVAKAVEHAALSEKPGARYPIGWPARVVTRVRGLIPDRLFDLVCAASARELAIPTC